MGFKNFFEKHEDLITKIIGCTFFIYSGLTILALFIGATKLLIMLFKSITANTL